LELSEIGSADISHAGCYGTDQILTAVVDVCRTEEDLSQGASRSDPDSRPARQVGMRGCHAPMVAFARRFNCFRESAADHDGVRAASKGLADVASLAHPPVGDNRDIFARLLVMVVPRRSTIDGCRYLRYTQPQDASRRTGCSRSDSNQNTRNTASDDFKRDVVSHSVADDHGTSHFSAENFKIKRF